MQSQFYFWLGLTQDDKMQWRVLATAVAWEPASGESNNERILVRSITSRKGRRPLRWTHLASTFKATVYVTATEF